MDHTHFIHERIHHYYWNNNINCATTILKILAEVHGLKLQDQVIDGAVGLHGAGGFGAQCGLVEGALLFIGIWGNKQGLSANITVRACRNYADAFNQRFGSLVCKELRPEGFGSHNPPHLCEKLTQEAVEFAVGWIEKLKTEMPFDIV
ncbi:MAG: C_GCAxxG_C_C family protein [Ignavibacteriae bacterium]|nr:MAG: C_GCAxxG_C_C family protein [Ignavibacteriota bacterium]